VALREAFYIENKRLDLDSLRVPSRSPTPICENQRCPRTAGPSLGGSETPFPSDLWGSGGPGRAKKHICLAFEAATTFLARVLVGCSCPDPFKTVGGDLPKGSIGSSRPKKLTHKHRITSLADCMPLSQVVCLPTLRACSSSSLLGVSSTPTRGRTYRIELCLPGRLNLNCESGPENGHGHALELVSGANFGCVLHHFCEPDPLERVSGPSSAGNGPKIKYNL
jgi:hypothetical protein